MKFSEVGANFHSKNAAYWIMFGNNYTNSTVKKNTMVVKNPNAKSLLYSVQFQISSLAINAFIST